MVDDLDAEELLYEMQATYRKTSLGLVKEPEFDRYMDCYTALSDKLIEGGEAEVLTDLVPLLENQEYGEARQLVEEETDLDSISLDGENGYEVFYMSDDLEGGQEK